MEYPVLTNALAEEVATYLSAHDPLLAPIIAQAGVCTITPHKDYYHQLVRSIIGQQLSVKAASAIQQRFLALFDGNYPAPKQILELDIEDLRAIGFSRPKAGYIQDLAAKILAGDVKFDHLDALSNEEVIAELTAIKGIGEWTVHMFLMSCMGRTDVLPVGDLGIRNGVTKLYNLPALASPEDIKRIATQNNWHPYESIASWYIWKSLEVVPI